MSNEFGYPHTGWNRPVREKSVLQVFVRQLRKEMDGASDDVKVLGVCIALLLAFAWVIS